MNTENNIPTLEEILNEFEAGTLETGGAARKCYLTELHKHKKIITWVHDHELRGHLLLKKMGKSASRDLLRQPNHKMT